MSDRRFVIKVTGTNSAEEFLFLTMTSALSIKQTSEPMSEAELRVALKKVPESEFSSLVKSAREAFRQG